MTASFLLSSLQSTDLELPPTRSGLPAKLSTPQKAFDDVLVAHVPEYSTQHHLAQPGKHAELRTSGVDINLPTLPNVELESGWTGETAPHPGNALPLRTFEVPDQERLLTDRPSWQHPGINGNLRHASDASLEARIPAGDIPVVTFPDKPAEHHGYSREMLSVHPGLNAQTYVTREEKGTLSQLTPSQNLPAWNTINASENPISWAGASGMRDTPSAESASTSIMRDTLTAELASRINSSTTPVIRVEQKPEMSMPAQASPPAQSEALAARQPLPPNTHAKRQALDGRIATLRDISLSASNTRDNAHVPRSDEAHTSVAASAKDAKFAVERFVTAQLPQTSRANEILGDGERSLSNRGEHQSLMPERRLPAGQGQQVTSSLRATVSEHPQLQLPVQGEYGRDPLMVLKQATPAAEASVRQEPPLATHQPYSSDLLQIRRLVRERSVNLAASGERATNMMQSAEITAGETTKVYHKVEALDPVANIQKLNDRPEFSEVLRGQRETVRLDGLQSDLQKQISDELSARLSRRPLQSDQFTIALSPKALGTLVVEIEVNAREVHVQIFAKETATRELLEQSSFRLRSSLEEGDMELKDLSIGEFADREGHTDEKRQRHAQNAQDEDERRSGGDVTDTISRPSVTKTDETFLVDAFV
ncbi:MAG: flagellar hook-length control protein FliK [Pseudomonadota bacterium]